MGNSNDHPQSGTASETTADGDRTDQPQTDQGRTEQRGTDEQSTALGRRAFLIGGGVLVTGSAGVLYTTTGADEPTFLLRQGYLRYEVDPIRQANGETNVRQFYDYQTDETSASPKGTIIDEDAAARMFIYDGPVDSSLVFLHGSPDVDHGGSAEFSFSGLSRDQGEWAVRDDPTRIDDDFDPWAAGNQKVEWGWGPGKTDGGAFWGGLDRSDFSITITPKQLHGVDSWRFLSGELGSLDAYDLYQEKPVTLRPARGRTVKRANVNIMPDSEDNEFDPYANEMLTVAVEAPPAGVDDSKWIAPEDLDPGNYAVNFGSKQYLAGENAAQPQKYFTKGGTLYLQYNARAANFSLNSAYGYLVSKVDDRTYVRGRDIVRPGGFTNAEPDDPELVITDLHVDPEGHDREALQDEYIEFRNSGDETLDLTGYTVSDAGGAAYRFPDGFTLDPEETFRLHTGSAADTRSDLYWGRDQPVWNNDGDTVIVTDANGDTVFEYTYPRH